MAHHSGAPVNTSPYIKFMSDLEVANHQLALPKGTSCEILTAFKLQIESQAVVFSLTLCCTSHTKDLPLYHLYYFKASIIYSPILCIQNSDL